MRYGMAHRALFHIGRNHGDLTKMSRNPGQRGNTRTVNAIVIGNQYFHNPMHEIFMPACLVQFYKL
jgi:hypothetical protein